MNLLLDTHTFIWWDSTPANLSSTALTACSDPDNTLVLSVASLWEMQIKVQLGKLQLRLPLLNIVTEQQMTNGLVLLSITEKHVYGLESLPSAHKDPFDRILAAQAIGEGISLVSIDSIFAAYPVQVVW